MGSEMLQCGVVESRLKICWNICPCQRSHRVTIKRDIGSWLTSTPVIALTSQRLRRVTVKRDSWLTSIHARIAHVFNGRSTQELDARRVLEEWTRGRRNPCSINLPRYLEMILFSALPTSIIHTDVSFCYQVYSNRNAVHHPCWSFTADSPTQDLRQAMSSLPKSRCQR